MIRMDAETWSLIKRLRESEHLSLSEISRRVRMDRKTVRSTLAQQTLPVRQITAPKLSKLDPYKEHIAQRLKEYPQLRGTVLFEEIKRLGYPGKLRILWEYLEEVRHKTKEVFLRIETLPGEFAQVDWANCGTISIGTAARKLSCFVMVLSYSRMMYLEFTLSQCLEDFIACHIHAFRFFGGITRKILYDNLKTVCLARIGSDIRFNPKFLEFSGVHLFEPVLCNPRRGNEKGKVESGIKYIRFNFLAGRDLASWPLLQQQSAHWLKDTANLRIHGTTRERPIDRFQKEIPFLQRLPDHEYDSSIVRMVKATSQALVHFDGNAYSVPAAFAYRAVLLKADNHEVRIFNDAQLLATHRRSFERGLAVEDPKHFAEILATKKKAFHSKIQDQFLALGESAKTYLQGLLTSELNIPHHLNLILECVRLYGKTEVLGAIHHALRFNAFGAPYLKNIILQQRAARGLKENLPILIPAKPAWTQLAVEDQDLSLYDDLFESDDSAEKE